VFVRRRKVIFVHGCFWHGHDCRSGRKIPKDNSGYWSTKLEKNRQRDIAHRVQLGAIGWQVLTLWECELANASQLEMRLRSFLETGNSIDG
jgi:DNA mismatch endonuclease (patch repair protein)